MGFDFDSATRRELGYKLIDCIDDYFSSLGERAVQLPAAERTFGSLTDKMPEFGEGAETVLVDACSELVDKGFHVPSANYFGLMNPTPTYMAVLAEALVAALNPQLASLARSQLASKVEAETVRWIGERVGWRAKFDGTFTSGGNEANFSALALALAWKFPHTIDDGVASIGAKAVLYASGEAHHSLDKSAGLLGLGRRALRRVAVNDRMQMNAAELERAIGRDLQAGHKPFCVVATVGTTNSGAVDELLAIADVCSRHELWLHVDGAYGAALIFSDKAEHRAMVRGMERCDSLTIDPHKWLAMPFAAGVVLTSHPELLQPTFSVPTPYMPRTSAMPALVDNFKVSTQWSRRMNSLKLWLTLRVHGRKGYEELITKQLGLARDFAAWVRESDCYELVTDPQLTIVNFTAKLSGASDAEIAAANSAIVDAVTDDGRRWISQTVVNGRNVLRMMVISYLTEQHHVRELQQALVKAAQKTALSCQL
jgi:glutamate/tyrosine decarboxylase-like PLP-dependent enzyme